MLSEVSLVAMAVTLQARDDCSVCAKIEDSRSYTSLHLTISEKPEKIYSPPPAGSQGAASTEPAKTGLGEVLLAALSADAKQCTRTSTKTLHGPTLTTPTIMSKRTQMN